MTAVSVVIPAFNDALWLPDALASVLGQTWPLAHLEVVVVDDGSTDDTSRVAERILSASSVAYTIVRNASSRGPSGARNMGWRRARGGWIQFLDADDVLDREKIAHQSSIARTAGVETAAIYSRWGRLEEQAGQWVAVDEHGYEPTLLPDPILAVMTTQGFLHVGCPLFRRDWLDTVGGFDERHRLIEDVDLELRLLMGGAQFVLAPSERPLYWYRARSGSLSRSSHGAFFEGSARNAQLAEEFWRGRGELTAERRQWLASHYFSCARVLAEHRPGQLGSLVERMYQLAPEFEPPQIGLRTLTRLVGYPRAERLTVQYRRIKRLLSRENAEIARPRPASGTS